MTLAKVLSLPLTLAALILCWRVSRPASPHSRISWRTAAVQADGAAGDAGSVAAAAADTAAATGESDEPATPLGSMDPTPEDSAAAATTCDPEPRLCCPACLKPLTGSVCPRCSLQYRDFGPGLDLTPASGRPLGAAEVEGDAPGASGLPFAEQVLPVIDAVEQALPPPPGGLPTLSQVLRGERAQSQGQTLGTATFENPLVAGVYERGWRQSFAVAGAPGPDEEFAQALRWLLPAGRGGAVLDASCGSGLFTRRFLTSGEFARVFALDYSEEMLQQTRDGVRNDAAAAAVPGLELVRADIARLPFESETLAAVHAGAALHCWPQPALAMAEIARVLRPGGVAVFSTFLVAGQDVLPASVRTTVVSPLMPGVGSGGFKWWEDAELKSLCSSVGLVGYEAMRQREYIMFTVRKPEGGF